MTTTELIELLIQNEKGGISHKPREISLTIHGKYMPNPQIALSSTGDGICGAEIDLDIDGDFMEGKEPCEDCISRKAVLDKLNRLIEVERLQGTDEMGYGRERVSAYENMIFEIESEYLYPSVTTQEPKTGHWIKMSDGFSPYQCSECETVEFKASNYCPKCGARLEVEE